MMSLAEIQNQLTPAEIRIIQELRAIEYGKLTVTKRDGEIIFITPAPDILVRK